MSHRLFALGMSATFVASMLAFSSGCDPGDPEGAAGGAGSAGAAGSPSCTQTPPPCKRPQPLPEAHTGAPNQDGCEGDLVCHIAAGAMYGHCIVPGCPTDIGGASGSSGASGAGGGAGSAGSAGQGGNSGQGGSAGSSPCDPQPPCTRPVTTPLSAPYLGTPGNDGCAINASCRVEVGNNQGGCVTLGCGAGEGGAGGSTGTPPLPPETSGGNLSPGTAVSGAVPCNASPEFTFNAQASEVMTIRLSWWVDPMAGAGAFGELTLHDPDGPIFISGNPVGFSGALYPGPPSAQVLPFNFRKTGPHKLVFANTPPGCGTLGFALRVDPKVPPATNLTRAAAAPLAKGATASGTFGGNEHRWYTVSVAAGEAVQLKAKGQIFPEVSIPENSFVMALENDDGPLPLNGGGAEIAVTATQTPATSPTTLDFTFESAGTYYIHLSQYDGPQVIDFTLGY